MPSNLYPRSQRRQNASCDRCRQSKRRCLIAPSQEQEPQPICINCKRLSYSCTFNFADSRKTSSSRKGNGRISTLQDQPSTLKNTELLESSDRNYQGAQNHNSISASSIELDFDSFVDFGLYSLPDHQDTLAISEIARPSICGPNSRSIVGLSLSSPVHLLSSTWEAWLLSEQLARIYQTITSDSASIFLDYNCNLLTGSQRYQFDQSSSVSRKNSADELSNAISEDATHIQFTLSNPIQSSSNQDSNLLSMVDSGVRPQIPQNRPSSCTITVLGAVRFLDHFGELYGNHLSVTAKAQSNQILREVLRCFSFQWLPNTIVSIDSDAKDLMFPDFPPGPQPQHSHLAYVDTWTRARSLIKNAQSTVSFGVVYSTLLFDTIVIPAEASQGLANDVLEHGFLDNAFHKLSQLEYQVKKYCANLGTKSQHGALVESSLSIIRWFAYLRDTVVGLMASRPCRLADVDSQNKESLNIEFFSPLEWYAEDNLPNICRRAIASAFGVWRKVIKLRESTKGASIEFGVSCKIDLIVKPTVQAVSEFEQSFGTFMNYCRDNLSTLSNVSRKFIVFLVIFWDLGILILAEVLESISSCEAVRPNEQLVFQMQKYRWESALSVARMIECVLDLPTTEAFPPSSGLDPAVPLTASHVNNVTVVLALQKSIEHIIESQADNLFPDGTWDRYLGILMKGLVALGVTVGGSRTATVSLQNLMQTHGDVLAECWFV